MTVDMGSVRRDLEQQDSITPTLEQTLETVGEKAVTIQYIADERGLAKGTVNTHVRLLQGRGLLQKPQENPLSGNEDLYMVPGEYLDSDPEDCLDDRDVEKPVRNPHY